MCLSYFLNMILDLSSSSSGSLGQRWGDYIVNVIDYDYFEFL